MFLNLLFPKRCLGCKKVGGYFCPSCVENILQEDLVCPFCERPSIGGLTHPICRRKFGLDGLWSLGIYQGSLKNGIQRLKYKFVKDLASDLVDLTINYWAKNQPALLEKIKKSEQSSRWRGRGESWIITSVPLHQKRQNWRGFNQSEEIAKLLAQGLGLKYEPLLKRIKYTKPQVTLKSYDRKQNIKGAFNLIENEQSSRASRTCKLEIENCILIDDVWTTGSTLRECGYILKRAGVKQVWALTLAR